MITLVYLQRFVFIKIKQISTHTVTLPMRSPLSKGHIFLLL
jgi:hypothetical protein